MLITSAVARQQVALLGLGGPVKSQSVLQPPALAPTTNFLIALFSTPQSILAGELLLQILIVQVGQGQCHSSSTGRSWLGSAVGNNGCSLECRLLQILIVQVGQGQWHSSSTGRSWLGWFGWAARGTDVDVWQRLVAEPSTPGPGASPPEPPTCVTYSSIPSSPACVPQFGGQWSHTRLLHTWG